MSIVRLKWHSSSRLINHNLFVPVSPRHLIIFKRSRQFRCIRLRNDSLIEESSCGRKSFFAFTRCDAFRGVVPHAGVEPVILRSHRSILRQNADPEPRSEEFSRAEDKAIIVVLFGIASAHSSLPIKIQFVNYYVEIWIVAS